jgi:hypothetical protein
MNAVTEAVKPSELEPVNVDALRMATLDILNRADELLGKGGAACNQQGLDEIVHALVALDALVENLVAVAPAHALLHEAWGTLLRRYYAIGEVTDLRMMGSEDFCLAALQGGRKNVFDEADIPARWRLPECKVEPDDMPF